MGSVAELQFLVSWVMLIWQTKGKLPEDVSCRSFLHYAVPGLLYSASNNLSMMMQVYMDPTTFQVLSNLKIGITAVLYWGFLRRPLTLRQWIAVGILTMAGTLDSYGSYVSKGKNFSELYITITGLVMIIAQCVVSGMASVYAEYILKKQKEMSLHFQNIMLYTWLIIINTSFWIYEEVVHEDKDNTGKFHLFRGYTLPTWMIVVTQVYVGLAMSFILKHGSNITRLFVVSSSLSVTTVLSVLVFGLHLNSFFFTSLGLLLVSLYLFHGGK
ncbi:probable UDP-sugar transporter protein SLC35A4 isoform X2 [Ostrea edulis]|uniref:probable UDP-sugar transporter protein SLC35A4 isoform X2 n=1 Tax=Ostrea edulis TaxID=37623 RepID=UPI0024AF7F68|nr:probable UDP-sugar transporter protein SLC35A4 isoform X2 [Ostrea edulis]XP_056021722.1 probable UDP-sugar transporter protein SLC35A4 isoform X2 [Ostrea edulis]